MAKRDLTPDQVEAERKKLEDKRPGAGNLVNRRQGRVPGSKNKIPRTLKQAILYAAEKVGSDGKGKDGLEGYLSTQAIINSKSFNTMLSRVLPMTVANEDDEPFRHEVVVTLVEAKKPGGSK